MRRNGIPLYKIKDYSGDEVVGIWYEKELQQIFVNENDQLFKIENILKTRTRNKKKEHLVSWLYWPKKYDSWVPDIDLKELQS